MSMQVLLLAGPGVVIGTALTALFVQYAFPYNWTWTESLLFGAMLSATDPVAVIALLQEVSLYTNCPHFVRSMCYVSKLLPEMLR